MYKSLSNSNFKGKKVNNWSYLLFKTKLFSLHTPHIKFSLNKNMPHYNRFHVNCYLNATYIHYSINSLLQIKRKKSQKILTRIWAFVLLADSQILVNNPYMGNTILRYIGPVKTYILGKSWPLAYSDNKEAMKSYIKMPKLS